MIYQGSWQPNVKYSSLDVVTYNGESYCATEEIESNNPPNVDLNKWFKIAKSGNDFSLSASYVLTEGKTLEESLPATENFEPGSLIGIVENNNLHLYILTSNYFQSNLVKEWKYLGVHKYSQKIYSGNENFRLLNNEYYMGLIDENDNPIFVEEEKINDKYFYPSDIYLKIDNGLIYQCIESGTHINAKWEQVGPLNIPIEKTFTATILKLDNNHNWLEQDGKYYQDIVLEGITELDEPLINLILSNDEEQAINQKNNWSFISKIVSYNGGLRVWCYDSCPTIDLPVLIKVFAVNDFDPIYAYKNLLATSKYNEEIQSPTVKTSVDNNKAQLDFEFPVPEIGIGTISEVTPEGHSSVTSRVVNDKILLDFTLRSGEGLYLKDEFETKGNKLSIKPRSYLPSSLNSDLLTAHGILSFNKQDLTTEQQELARENLGLVDFNFLFDPEQQLTTEQREILKEKIGLQQVLEAYMLLSNYVDENQKIKEALKAINADKAIRADEATNAINSVNAENAVNAEYLIGKIEIDGVETTVKKAVNDFVLNTTRESDLVDINEKINNREPGKKILNNIEITNNHYSEPADRENFPYTITINHSEINSSQIPEVMFNFEDAISGNFAGYAETFNNGIRLYAQEKILTTIPTIILWNN